MPIQIALAWSKKCEKELTERGFEKREVYIKDAPFSGKTSKEDCRLGDSELFEMKHSPFQFITTSWWGAAPD